MFEFTQSSLEVDSGSRKHTLRLQRTGDLSVPASIQLMAVDGTAWEQRDFAFGWQEVDFEVNQADADITFTALERNEKHVNSAFSIKMMYASTGELTTQLATVSIQSTNLPVIGSVSLAQTTYSVAENAGSVTLTINRNGGTDSEAKVSVTTRNQTAISGTDFTALNTEVTFADGQSTATVAVTITNNSTYEGSRNFAIDIAPVTTGLTTGSATTTVTITDDETPPVTGVGTGGGTDGGSSESSGGSFGFLSLILGLLLAWQRKR